MNSSKFFYTNGTYWPIVSMILLFSLNCFSLSQVTVSCNCNETDKICGKNSEQCEIIPNTQPFTYLMIILTIIIIAVFFGRCVVICLSCRNVQNETLSNNTYHPIVITDSNIPIDEESSPPSYEQAINDNNSYRFENPR